jgi:hypothetical protein
MKKTLYLFLFAAALAACNPPTTTTGNTTPEDSGKVVVTEPKDSTPVTDTTATVQPDSSTGPDGGRIPNPNGSFGKKTFAVTGHILIQGSYCGGAAPSKEMEEEARRPKPYAKQPLLIREGKANALGTAMVTRTTTDANGDFKVDLPAGSYCLVLAEKERTRDAGFYNLTYMQVDKPCDTRWLNTCDITFTVADRPVSGLRLTLQKKCFIESLSPCITYTGPKPGSAAPKGRE